MKLDLCGGEYPIGNGFTSIDIKPYPKVKVVCNLEYNLPFKEESIEEIFSCGTIEHFSLKEVLFILKECKRILKRDGKISIGIPNLMAIIDYPNSIDFMTINYYLYGSHKDKYDIHKSIFDFKNLSLFLRTAGFKRIRKQPYDMPFHIKEYMLKVTALA